MSERGAPEPHLVLVGLPGAGKSAVGRLVAARTGRRFLDFDQEIERREGLSIPELFRDRGEPWFRAAERALTLEVAGEPGMVLSPGGGWITNPGLVGLLRPRAYVVHLLVTPATALSRMGEEVARRPLLAGEDPLAAITALWRRRREAYSSADAVIDTEVLALQEVADRVAALASREGAGRVNH